MNELSEKIWNKPKYDIGQTVFFVWPGDRFYIVEAVVKSVEPKVGDNNNNDIFNLTYSYGLTYENNQEYGRYENDLFPTKQEAEMFSIKWLISILSDKLLKANIIQYPIR